MQNFDKQGAIQILVLYHYHCNCDPELIIKALDGGLFLNLNIWTPNYMHTEFLDPLPYIHGIAYIDNTYHHFLWCYKPGAGLAS